MRFLWSVFHLLRVPVVIRLPDRYTVSERRLTEETPPVVSSACPPGRLLLLTDRHAHRPGALWPLPQCGHQEKLHSVTPALAHFPLLRCSKWREVLVSTYCPRVIQRQVRCRRRLQTCLCLYHGRDLLLAVSIKSGGTGWGRFYWLYWFSEPKWLQICRSRIIQHKTLVFLGGGFVCLFFKSGLLQWSCHMFPQYESALTVCIAR